MTPAASGTWPTILRLIVFTRAPYRPVISVAGTRVLLAMSPPRCVGVDMETPAGARGVTSGSGAAFLRGLGPLLGLVAGLEVLDLGQPQRPERRPGRDVGRREDQADVIAALVQQGHP